jgi:hypothetical protein
MQRLLQFLHDLNWCLYHLVPQAWTVDRFLLYSTVLNSMGGNLESSVTQFVGLVA